VLSVRRRYLFVLLAAAAAAVLSVVIPNNGAATTARSPADYALARAAFNRIKLPSDFVRVSSFDPGAACLGDRCYVVTRPTRAIAAILPSMIRSVATIRPHSTACTLLPTQGHATMEQCLFRAKVAGSVGFLVIVGPYIACSRPHDCRLTTKSEVLIDGLNGSQPGPATPAPRLLPT
jgi:hypothetical protein